MAVVPRSGTPIAQALLQAHLAQRLAAYKIPQQFVFVDELPRNASGKVLRHQLQARCQPQ